MRFFRCACTYLLLMLGTVFGMEAAYAAPFAYISNLSSNTVSVIDTATNTVVATVPVGAGPYGVAVNPAGTIAYVVNRDSSTVSVINTATNAVVATVPVGPGPHGIAINAAGSFAYVVNALSSSVTVIDTATNAVVGGVTVGSHPVGIAISPAGDFAYVANRDSSTVSVINTATRAVVATVPVGPSPYGIAINPAGTFVYVTGSNRVSVINTATRAVVATVSVFSVPLGLAVNPAGTIAYVTNSSASHVTLIDTATNAVFATVSVGSAPLGISINPAGTFVYVANQGSNTVSVINAATNIVVATVPVGFAPVAFGQFIASPQIDPPRLANISTRMQVLTGNDVMIGGFVIGGSANKTVVVRARGPSLVPFGITNALANPTLQLVRSSDQSILATNDDWITGGNSAAITASGFAPSDSRESAILMSLPPGAYTAIVQGVGSTTGVGIIEVFEVDAPTIPLANISTRGQVLTGNDVMIGGFVVQGDGPKSVVIRARGPSLIPFGITNALANPTLQLVRSSDQQTLAENDNWGASTNAAAITASGFAPSNALESAILITLQPGAYTAIVRGAGGGTGVGIVEVFAQ